MDRIDVLAFRLLNDQIKDAEQSQCAVLIEGRVAGMPINGDERVRGRIEAYRAVQDVMDDIVKKLNAGDM